MLLKISKYNDTTNKNKVGNMQFIININKEH